jgi:hypothetical protein
LTKALSFSTGGKFNSTIFLNNNLSIFVNVVLNKHSNFLKWTQNIIFNTGFYFNIDKSKCIPSKTDLWFKNRVVSWYNCQKMA